MEEKIVPVVDSFMIVMKFFFFLNQVFSVSISYHIMSCHIIIILYSIVDHWHRIA